MDTKRSQLEPRDISAPFGNYAHGIQLEKPTELVFASGQLGMSKDGAIPDNVAEQSRICFQNIEKILSEAGMDFSHVVKVSAFVTSRGYFPDYMAVRDSFLPAAVASTLLIVSGFTRPEFKVEVEVVAAR